MPDPAMVDAPAQLVPSAESAVRTAHPPAAASWETELFLLRGDEREDLCRRIRALLGYLEKNPDVVLKDLAFTLLDELKPGGERLAVVAGSAADLRKRLERALSRLEDAACRQIRDTVGIYYFSEPLGGAGRLAVLFPGEGAHYLNMLADLYDEFAEVRAFLDDCDAITARSGAGDRSPWRLLLVLPEAGEAERRQAEARLRDLGVAMCSVLAADWALWVLLGQLGLPAGALAGHSMGEMAALSAAGAMVDNSMSPVLAPLLAWLETIQKEEASGQTAAVVLLAIAAGRARVTELVQAHSGGPQESRVYVAMDNCPHQSVVIGPPNVMAVLESALLAQGIVCERLPFHRPYHTPLFRPSLAPLETMYARVPFKRPEVPVYSCSTGRRFPDDPDEVRRLMIDHWASPVEFTRLIENMHADGIRVFVECGPRGNLTAFVEDILRGRPFIALPANVAHRSGLTQLNHLVGQLVAHHVPLRLEYLYRHRQPKTLSIADFRFLIGAEPDSQQPFAIDNQKSKIQTTRAQVMARYLGVMDQFLEVQQGVMQGFLARRTAARALGPRRPVQPAPTEAASASDWPLAGHVVRLVAGQEVVVRRRLDLAEDIVVGDHTLGGRQVSKIDPAHHGVPITPMTFVLEMMAQAAALLAPGRVVIGVQQVKLFRWLAYDEDTISSVEITAKAQPADGSSVGVLAVKVEVADLGAGASEARTVTARGTVLLADRYPPAPAARSFALANDRPCRISLEVLYRNLFHGPKFQGVLSTGRVGDQGIECPIVVLPRHDHFASHPQPRYHLDPVLLDVSMHPQVAWHLEQPDQSGRILLPIELERLEVFGPPLAEGTQLLARCWITDSSARHFTHSGEAVGPDGRIRFRLTGVRCWRFYVPFGDVNFHGPKDEYFLSRPCPQLELLPQGRSFLTDCPVQHGLMLLDPPADVQHLAMRTVTVRIVLTRAEARQFRDVQAPEMDKFAWLFQRLVGKDAVRVLWHKRQGRRLFPVDIDLNLDATGRGVARVLDAPNGSEQFPVAVAVERGRYVGVSAAVDLLGVGLARVEPQEEGDPAEHLARVAASRRALAQAVSGDGSVTPERLELSELDGARGLVWLGFGAERWLVRTEREADWVVAIALGERETR